MGGNLAPYDPDGNQQRDRTTEPQSGDKHYHYYDQRTFVQGSPTPGEDDEPEEEAPPILASWQKKALGLIAVVSLIGVASQCVTIAPTVTTTNTTETTTTDLDSSIEATGTPEREPASLRDLAIAGDASACDHPAVLSYLQAQIMGDLVNPNPDEDYGMTRGQDMARARSEIRLSLDTVSVSAIDPGIHSVTCAGNIVINDSSGSKTFGVAYEISPNVSDSGTAVIRTDSDQLKTIASNVQGAITARAMSLTEQATGEDLVRRFNRRNSSSAAPPSTEPEPEPVSNGGESAGARRP